MLLKTAICEDNPTQAKNMRRLLSLWSRERGQAAVIQDYDSCEAFLWDWNQKMDFDLLLLDIDLGGEINGMELARRIREKDDEVVIIFVSGLPEYMSQGYDVKACHFLVKPVEEGKLLTVLDRALKELAKREEYLLLEEGAEAWKIPVSRILYVEAFSHTAALYLVPESGEKAVCREVKMCLGDLAERLPQAGFIRCHRSYLVYLPYIRRIGRVQAFLDYGAEVPVSRGKREEVYRAFMEYHKGKLEDDSLPGI